MARNTLILHHHHHDLYFHPVWSSSASSQSISLNFFNGRPTTICLRRDLTSFSSSLSSSSYPSFCSVRRVSTAPVESASVPEDFDFQNEIARLHNLRSRLSHAKNLREKLGVLDLDSRVKDFFGTKVLTSFNGLGLSELFLLKCLVAAGQEHVFGSEFDFVESEFDPVKGSLKSALYVLVDMIEKLDVNNGGVEETKSRGHDRVLAPLKKLLRTLQEIEQFYDCIGGIIG